MGGVMEAKDGASRARMGLLDLQELTFETVARVVEAWRDGAWSDEAVRESFEAAAHAVLSEAGGPMSRSHTERVLSELDRAPIIGITRGELAILMLDVDDDSATDALGALLRSGEVTATARDDLVRYRRVVP
jgi:hypothetical protein